MGWSILRCATRCPGLSFRRCGASCGKAACARAYGSMPKFWRGTMIIFSSLAGTGCQRDSAESNLFGEIGLYADKPVVLLDWCWINSTCSGTIPEHCRRVICELPDVDSAVLFAQVHKTTSGTFALSSEQDTCPIARGFLVPHLVKLHRWIHRFGYAGRADRHTNRRRPRGRVSAIARTPGNAAWHARIPAVPQWRPISPGSGC